MLFNVKIGCNIVIMINRIMFVIDIISKGLNILSEILISVLNFLFWLFVVWVSICCSLFDFLFDVIICIIIGGNIFVLFSVVWRLLFFLMLMVVFVIWFLICWFFSILFEMCIVFSSGIVLVFKIFKVCVKCVVLSLWDIWLINGKVNSVLW